jgi:hypothetical protein
MRNWRVIAVEGVWFVEEMLWRVRLRIWTRAAYGRRLGERPRYGGVREPAMAIGLHRLDDVRQVMPSGLPLLLEQDPRGHEESPRKFARLLTPEACLRCVHSSSLTPAALRAAELPWSESVEVWLRGGSCSQSGLVQ